MVRARKNTKVVEEQVEVVSEREILNASSPQEVIELVTKLTSTTQDKIFAEYRAKAEAQLAESNRLVQELTAEVAAKQAVIDSLKNGVVQTPGHSQQQNLYISPIRRRKGANSKQGVVDEKSQLITQEELTKELETIGITLDMLELLTGLRITNYEEDSTRFHFDITQASTTGSSGEELTFSYRLFIAKDFKDTAEISYLPMTSSDNEHIDKLKEVLPEYFWGNLSFPYNTLSQFYTKINRALIKGAKSA
ncbi:hypothetical protein CAAN1_03S00936 [[Candida] anglica]|uniref:Monopolin complex subunit Csm1/Pcs1 C-terminal domain-containing protein n=1 Tax=[Candida] anglica TaxID=148631 RepID=A0ABP0EGJ2_9ASCO